MKWCIVWKGSVSDCLSHLHEKHGGSQYVAMNNLGKFFPPWTVPRDVWQMALCPDVSGVAVDIRLFYESGCLMEVLHKYRVYKDPFLHPALRGRVMNKLLALVARAMAIAQLTPPHIDTSVGIASMSGSGRMFPDCAASTSVGGSPPGFVRQRGYHYWCFPGIGEWLPDPMPVDLPYIQIHDPVYPCIPEEDTMDVSTEIADPHVPVLPPPLGFE